MISPFHLAFPVDDLQKARDFYTQVLQCEEGRSSDTWIDFNLFGHQIVAHLDPGEVGKNRFNQVDGKSVPTRHFGVVLPGEKWVFLSNRIKELNIEFLIEPYSRFKGEKGEQGTFFVLDPAGNALEFKTFKNMDQLFAK